MPNHRNVYISLATSMSKTGKFQLTPLVLRNITSVLLKNSVNSVMEKFVTKRRKEREKAAILQLTSTFFQCKIPPMHFQAT